MEKDKGHLVNIEKIEYHYHNHVDTSEILSLLNIIKLQNRKILEEVQDNDNEKVKDLAAKLKQGTDSLKKAIAENTSLKT